MMKRITSSTPARRLGRTTSRRLTADVAMFLALVLAVAILACQDGDITGAFPAEPLAPSGPSFSHGPFPSTAGIYRIPYADGLDVLVTNDHHDHSPVNRIDMRVGVHSQIVAAASGWIRAIVEHHGQSPNPGDGLDNLGNPQDDALEHACVDAIDADSVAIENSVVTGFCSRYNNYLWIEHPNGEWTKYSHMGTGTVSDQGWQVGDWVNAGEVLGLENDIGRATGSHLHFEVAVPNDPTLPLQWSTLGGFIQNASNRVPRICDIQGGLFVTGQTYTAAPCNHLPPTADAGGPYVVDEGTPILLDGTGSTDPDGLPLTYAWSPSANLNNASLAQPTFVAGTSMVVDLTLTVYDQVEALADSSTTTVTVNNVAPAVTIDPDQVTVIDEGGTVTVVAEFLDPGYLDTHTATIDWGVPAGLEGIELAPATIQILDLGGPGQPLRGRVTGTYQYGDNDDGSGFTITVTVTDSDNGSGNDSFALTVSNVDPSPAIDPSGTVLLNGVPTVVASAGEELGFEGHVLDPGSDDLTLTWDWDDGTSDDHIFLVNPPGADPLPSPTVQERSELHGADHTFAEACMYEVTFSAVDDDGGQGSAAVDVLIVGNADQTRSAGYWTTEYRENRRSDFTAATLTCYLEIAAHASAVFDEERPLSTYQDAVDVLWVAGTAEPDDLFDRALLAAWLNFANGAIGLHELVDTTGDGVADTPFLAFMVAAEAVRNDPARTPAELLALKDALERLSTGN